MSHSLFLHPSLPLSLSPSLPLSLFLSSAFLAERDEQSRAEQSGAERSRAERSGAEGAPRGVRGAMRDMPSCRPSPLAWSFLPHGPLDSVFTGQVVAKRRVSLARVLRRKPSGLRTRAAAGRPRPPLCCPVSGHDSRRGKKPAFWLFCDSVIRAESQLFF